MDRVKYQGKDVSEMRLTFKRPLTFGAVLTKNTEENGINGDVRSIFIRKKN